MYVNIDMRSTIVSRVFQFLPSEGNRNHWDLNDNETPSVADAVYQKERSKREREARTQKERQSPLKIPIKDAFAVSRLLDPVSRIRISEEAIRHHFEEKISTFLMQLIDCYDTSSHYTIGVTENQTTSTSAVQFVPGEGVVFPPGSKTKMTYASAHHGTIPCLYAYEREKWEKWKRYADSQAPGKPTPGKPTATVYFKDSDTYRVNNACTGLEKVINEVDIDIDGNATERQVEFGRRKEEGEMKLREYGISLLNKAAKKEITPLEGFVLFLTKLESLINQNCNHPCKEHRAVSRILKHEMHLLQGEYQGRMKFCVARLLGIHIPRGDLETVDLERIIFPRRYEIIRKKNFYQTQLSARIQLLAEDILKQAPQKPKTFDKALKAALVEHASHSEEPVRRIFQRYYNLNARSIEQLKRDCFQPAKNLVYSSTSQKLIQKMMKDFSLYLRNFTIDESHFRSNLVNEIRKVKGISLRRFCFIHNEKFPEERRLNHEQLRRIEMGHVKTTPDMIRRFAAVLQVPINYFITNFSETIL